MSDIEFSKESQAASLTLQGITFAAKKKEPSAAEDDESLNLEMIKQWEANHPKAAGKTIKGNDKETPPG